MNPIIYFFDDYKEIIRIPITRISMVTRKRNPVILHVNHVLFTLRTGPKSATEFFCLN